MNINNSRPKRSHSRIKRLLRKIKYLDKTKGAYFIVVTFIGAFLLFTTITFSAFVINNVLNTTIIKIAKLDYTLNIENASFLETDNNLLENIEITNSEEENSVIVPANKKMVLDLLLSTENTSKTKYTFKYSIDEELEENDLIVNYSHNNRNNMSGIIGASAQINLRVVLTNQTAEDIKVNFNVLGGYLNNDLEETNILEGYYEHDFVSRVFEINYDNDTEMQLQNNFSTLEDKNYYEESNDKYYYFRTVCTESVKPRMIYENEKWKLNVSGITSQVACDTYYKNISEIVNIEKYYELEDTFELVDDIKPYLKNNTDDEEDKDYYILDDVTCSNGEVAEYNEETNEIINPDLEEDEKTICVAHFKHIIETE